MSFICACKHRLVFSFFANLLKGLRAKINVSYFLTLDSPLKFLCGLTEVAVSGKAETVIKLWFGDMGLSLSDFILGLMSCF